MYSIDWLHLVPTLTGSSLLFTNHHRGDHTNGNLINISEIKLSGFILSHGASSFPPLKGGAAVWPKIFFSLYKDRLDLVEVRQSDNYPQIL